MKHPCFDDYDNFDNLWMHSIEMELEVIHTIKSQHDDARLACGVPNIMLSYLRN